MLALAAIRNTERQIVDFQIIALNEGAATLLCGEKNALQWKWLSELELDLDLDFTTVRDRFVQALLSGARDQFEVTSPGERGAPYLKISVSPINDLLAVTLTDIGDLKAREESFRLLFDSNPVPMWLFSPKTLGFMSVNDAALAHYGYSREQFLNMSALDIRPEEERDIAEAQLRSFNGAYHPDRDWRHLRSDGSEIQVLPYLRSLNFKDSPAILAAVFDVTDRRQAEARIAHMAHHDALTGLPNRVLFRERLDEALSRVRRHSEMLAVLCLDLDHFKSVNDTLGHPIGDLLLKAVARRLETCLREVDIVARLGGDEFAIIQSTGKGPQEASRLASRLVEEVSKPYDLDGHQVVIGVSIGIATAPSDGNTPDILLKNADMALYRAKADGRRTFCFFEPEMDARLQARRLLELDLRRALAAGEFELFYQPLVNVNSNAITGFEALLRWRHPQRGMVSPAEFIPLAEEIGLIVPLGEWVLRQACAQAATWPDTLSIAVNLSPVQFRSSNLVPAVVSALANSGLPAGRLELEITESVLLQESEGNLATLHQLRALGAHIAMDDFGTGYSSLGYLRSFPFDKIKIDQTFVRELDNNPDCIAIISAVTGLGARLGIRTLAEGVETQEQLEQLRAEGCTEVQGYLFSEPVPASDLRQLLEVCRRRERAA
ncbi:MAG TPA: EAL domain-containing protein [Xanthobacteraceae bacterium]|nr:EAL domain-containing protein [Xanthobacteraceae bacterium]